MEHPLISVLRRFDAGEALTGGELEILAKASAPTTDLFINIEELVRSGIWCPIGSAVMPSRDELKGLFAAAIEQQPCEPLGYPAYHSQEW